MTKEEITKIIKSYKMDEKYNDYFHLSFRENQSFYSTSYIIGYLIVERQSILDINNINEIKCPIATDFHTTEESIIKLIEDGIKSSLAEFIEELENIREKLSCI